MSERLSSADVSFFYLEGRTTPQHVGGIAVFAPTADGFDYDRLVRLLEERISLVPRYRQKMRAIPAHLANPVWVDDPNFDITYHVRRSALPRPGTQAQLLEFCARIQSWLLDRTRPLWEMYLVEGLADGQIAIVTKTHHAMVDGVGAIDIGQVILDSSPEPLRTVEALWMPEPEPSSTELLLEALAGFAHRPAAIVDAVRLGIKDVRASTGQLTSVAGTALSTALALVRRAPSSPLTVKVGQQRRIAVARTRLDDYRQVRQAHGGTVNDVALATVAGALRGWLLQRGEAVAPTLVVRALVPVSVSDDDDDGAGPGHVTPLLVDLPVGEPSPLQRLSLDRQRDGRAPALGTFGGRRRAGGLERLRAADPARTWVPRRQGADPPDVQPGRHQCPRTAAPAVRRGRPDDRDVPDPAARPGAGCLDRDHVLRRRGFLRRQRRSGRDARRRGARHADRGVPG